MAAAHLRFDDIQITDALQRFDYDVGRGAGMHAVDFSSGVRHAGRFRNAAVFVRRVIYSHRRDPSEGYHCPLRVLLWMHVLTVRRVLKPAAVQAAAMHWRKKGITHREDASAGPGDGKSQRKRGSS